MPTYDYHCNSCNKDLEIFHSMNEEPRTKCPECGKNTLQRMISSGAGIIFKGSGFYETDYKKPKQEQKSPPKGSSPTPSKTDNKKPKTS